MQTPDIRFDTEYWLVKNGWWE